MSNEKRIYLGLMARPFKDIDENRLKTKKHLGNLITLICIVMNVADIFTFLYY